MIYHYYVSYSFLAAPGEWGFGSAGVNFSGHPNSMETIREIQKKLEDGFGKPGVKLTILGMIFLGKKRGKIPVPQESGTPVAP